MDIRNFTYDEDAEDHWQPVCGADFTSKKFYEYAFNTIEAHPIFRSIWKLKCTAGVKFFAWLLLVDRLNTKIMLTRRHIQVDNDNLCVICSTGAEETIEHLFFTCPFAR
jgi:hypothetical protein